MKTIVIKNIEGKVIYTYKGNGEIKDAVEEAVKNNINLSCANLCDADLSGAELTGALLYGATLKRANLCGAILSDANLSRAILSDANLATAVLRRANIQVALFENADLSRANLLKVNAEDTVFNKANLQSANLSCVNFQDANFIGVNFKNARVEYTIFSGAIMREAKNVPYIPLACPSDGAFIGWKKVLVDENECLVKLLIPEDARRCSATTNKCRCDKAKVLEITNIKTGEKINEVLNVNYASCTYIVGEMVYPDSFDEDRWHECSHGIHFFINKQDAINY